MIDWVREPVRVRTPATSANLGPGFDAFGLALDWHDELTAEVTGGGLDVDVTGVGADRVPRDERHLIVRAMRAAFERLGGQPPGLRLVCENRIPHGRGLGSSAAAICAGVAAANALAGDGKGLDADDLLDIAATLEGHPDNVAACLRGALTIAWTTTPATPTPPTNPPPAAGTTADDPSARGSGVAASGGQHGDAASGAGDAAASRAARDGATDVRVGEAAGGVGSSAGACEAETASGVAGARGGADVGRAAAGGVGADVAARGRGRGFGAVTVWPVADVVPVVWVPGTPLSTEVARGLLPGTVPHADAAFTAGRAGLLVAALTAPMPAAERRELLLAATEERLHQRYRAPAMPESAELIEELRSRGIAAVVSGAGPTVLAFVMDGDPDGNIARAVPVSSFGGAWETRRLPVDGRGVQVFRATRGNL